MTRMLRSLPLAAALALALAPGLATGAQAASPASALETPAPEPTARPGDRTVWVSFERDTPAARARLAALGYRLRSEVRVMYARKGRKICEPIYEGFLPASALEAARAVPGVAGVSVRD